MREIITAVLALALCLTLSACKPEPPAPADGDVQGGQTSQDDPGDQTGQGDDAQPGGTVPSGGSEPAPGTPDIQGTPGDSGPSSTEENELVKLLASLVSGCVPAGTETFDLMVTEDPNSYFGRWFAGVSIPEGADVAVNMMADGGDTHLVLLLRLPQGGDRDGLLTEMVTCVDKTFASSGSERIDTFTTRGDMILYILSDASLTDASAIKNDFLDRELDN